MPIWTKSPEGPPLDVALLLFERFSALCLANCLEPLRAANTLAGRALFRWRILSPTGGTVRSSSGLELVAGDARAVAGKVDHLAVIASYDHLAHDSAATRRLLSRLARGAREVAGHDAGPWLMASAGLLDGRMATIHRDLLDPFAERFLEVTALRERVVRDGARLTSAGAMAAYDLTLDLVRAAGGAALALDVEGLFLSGADAPRGDQPRPGDPVVAAALRRMRETLAAPLPLPALAAELGEHPKRIERRFRAQLGAAPGQVYRHLRLGAAFQMVTTGQAPLGEVALACGFDSPAAFSRAFARRYGHPPRAARATEMPAGGATKAATPS